MHSYLYELLGWNTGNVRKLSGSSGNLAEFFRSLTRVPPMLMYCSIDTPRDPNVYIEEEVVGWERRMKCDEEKESDREQDCSHEVNE